MQEETGVPSSLSDQTLHLHEQTVMLLEMAQHWDIFGLMEKLKQHNQAGATEAIPDAAWPASESARTDTAEQGGRFYSCGVGPIEEQLIRNAYRVCAGSRKKTIQE